MVRHRVSCAFYIADWAFVLIRHGSPSCWSCLFYIMVNIYALIISNGSRFDNFSRNQVVKSWSRCLLVAATLMMFVDSTIAVIGDIRYLAIQYQAWVDPSIDIWPTLELWNALIAVFCRISVGTVYSFCHYWAHIRFSVFLGRYNCHMEGMGSLPKEYCHQIDP